MWQPAEAHEPIAALVIGVIMGLVVVPSRTPTVTGSVITMPLSGLGRLREKLPFIPE
jgi:hypothetical protein